MFLAPKLGPGQLGPLVVDGTGSPVWFQPRPDVVVSDFRVRRYEETPVLTWWEGHSQGGYGSGVGVIADSSYTEVGRVSAGGAGPTGLVPPGRFETAIRLPTVPADVSVSALDASAAVLRASAQVDLSARTTGSGGG